MTKIQYKRILNMQYKYGYFLEPIKPVVVPIVQDSEKWTGIQSPSLVERVKDWMNDKKRLRIHN